MLICLKVKITVATENMQLQKKLCEGKFHRSGLREPLLWFLILFFQLAVSSWTSYLTSLDLSFFIRDVVKFKITKALKKRFANCNILLEQESLFSREWVSQLMKFWNNNTNMSFLMNSFECRLWWFILCVKRAGSNFILVFLWGFFGMTLTFKSVDLSKADCPL